MHSSRELSKKKKKEDLFSLQALAETRVGEENTASLLLIFKLDEVAGGGWAIRW